MKQIKYIGFYNNFTSQSLNSNLSAVNKMNYLTKILNEININVHLISTSWTTKSKVENRQDELNGNVYQYFKSRSFQPKIFDILYKLFFLVKINLLIMLSVKTKEKVVIYHSPFHFLLIILLRIKGAHVILEVEEIYYEVWNKYRKTKYMEYLCFLLANEYLLVSNNMVKHLPKKRYILFEGAYGVRNSNTIIKDNEKIRIVYAGSIEKTKNAAFIAVETSRYLTDYYEVSIIGYGEENCVKELEEKINQLPQTGIAKCQYIGSMSQEMLDIELQKYHIGLNSQLLGSYMESAFPSKLLVYLSNGLQVVSTPVKSVVNSNFGDYLIFSTSDSPMSIAKAINNARIDKFNVADEFLMYKESEFKESIYNIIKSN